MWHPWMREEFRNNPQKRDSMFIIRRLAEGGTSEQQRPARNILQVGYDGTVEKGGKREILRAAQEGRELEITDGVLGYERRKADIRRQWWTLFFAAFAAFGASYSLIAQIYYDVSAKIVRQPDEELLDRKPFDALRNFAG